MAQGTFGWWRVRSLGFALSLGMVVGACGEGDKPELDEDNSPIGEGAAPEKDASKPRADASRPSSNASDAGEPTDDKSEAPPSGSPADGGAGGSDSAWCKAKAVLDEKCVACHDGKQTAGAPMGLTSWDEAVADSPVTQGEKVYETIATRIHSSTSPMPPKGKLPADQLAALDAWIASGAKAGDDKSCAGATPTQPVADVWPPAECDAVYKITAGEKKLQEVAVGAEVHPQITLDAPWGSEQVQAIAFHPLTDNAKVLHHWILYSQAGAFLTGWAPGDDERGVFPPDVGMDMPTGAGSLRLDMHYFNLQGTQVEKDNSGVEVCVVKKDHFRKNHAAVTMSFTTFGPVLAPAGAVDKPITGTCKVQTTAPVHLLTASPHAHTYARHMKFSVKKKDGTEILMHDQPFMFGEQGSYALSPEVIIETGDTVYTTCSYTNMTTKNITFGESTSNEMCFNFAMYYPKGALTCSGGFGGGFLPGL
jgi:hypothetical protein